MLACPEPKGNDEDREVVGARLGRECAGLCKDCFSLEERWKATGGFEQKST